MPVNKTKKNVHPLNLLNNYTHPRNIPPLIQIPNQIPNQMPNLEELNRRVNICEQFLVNYNEMYTYMKQHPITRLSQISKINKLIFITHIPPFNVDSYETQGSFVYLGPDRKHPDLDESYFHIIQYKECSYKPDDIKFLHITPLQIMDTVPAPKDIVLNNYFLSTERNPAYRSIIYNLEGITHETISKALFETRLQIYQYENW